MCLAEWSALLEPEEQGVFSLFLKQNPGKGLHWFRSISDPQPEREGPWVGRVLECAQELQCSHSFKSVSSQISLPLPETEPEHLKFRNKAERKPCVHRSFLLLVFPPYGKTTPDVAWPLPWFLPLSFFQHLFGLGLVLSLPYVFNRVPTAFLPSL